MRWKWKVLKSFVKRKQPVSRRLPFAPSVTRSAEDLPLDMSQVFTDEGQVSIPRVLGQVALRPQSLPGLIRLGKNSRIAAESLARFLDSYVVALASRAAQLETKSSVAAV